MSAFFRFSPAAPPAVATRLTAFAGAAPAPTGVFCCTPSATFASAVPSGEGDTCRSFVGAAAAAVTLFSDGTDDAGVEHVLGVDGWSGCDGDGLTDAALVGAGAEG